MCVPGVVLECLLRATQGNKVNPRTRPCPHPFESWHRCPGQGRAVFPQPNRDLCSPRSALKGAARVGVPAPAQGVQAWPLTGLCSRLASALTSSRGAAPPCPQPASECPPLLGDTGTKQCWPFCKPGAAPSPEDRCKEPNPLIRTGRLGPHPAQARADFSGRKTCKLLPVGSPGIRPAGAWEASHFPWPPAGQVQLRPPGRQRLQGGGLRTGSRLLGPELWVLGREGWLNK